MLPSKPEIILLNYLHTFTGGPQKTACNYSLPISNLVLTKITARAIPISPPKNNIALQNARKNELINCGICLIILIYCAQFPAVYQRYFFSALFATLRHFANFVPDVI
ncbi:MAG: hypothetical protein ACU83U_12490 [Gammaproteobacteria bacterium]